VPLKTSTAVPIPIGNGEPAEMPSCCDFSFLLVLKKKYRLRNLAEFFVRKCAKRRLSTSSGVNGDSLAVHVVWHFKLIA